MERTAEGGRGQTWAVEPLEDDDDDEITSIRIVNENRRQPEPIKGTI